MKAGVESFLAHKECPFDKDRKLGTSVRLQNLAPLRELHWNHFHAISVLMRLVKNFCRAVATHGIGGMPFFAMPMASKGDRIRHCSPRSKLITVREHFTAIFLPVDGRDTFVRTSSPEQLSDFPKMYVIRKSSWRLEVGSEAYQTITHKNYLQKELFSSRRRKPSVHCICCCFVSSTKSEWWSESNIIPYRTNKYRLTGITACTEQNSSKRHHLQDIYPGRSRRILPLSDQPQWQLHRLRERNTASRSISITCREIFPGGSLCLLPFTDIHFTVLRYWWLQPTFSPVRVCRCPKKSTFTCLPHRCQVSVSRPIALLSMVMPVAALRCRL